MPTTIPLIIPHKGYQYVIKTDGKVPIPEDPVEVERSVAETMRDVLKGHPVGLDHAVRLCRDRLPFRLPEADLKVKIAEISEKWAKDEGPDVGQYVPPKPPEPVVVDLEPEPDPVIEPK